MSPLNQLIQAWDSEVIALQMDQESRRPSGIPGGSIETDKAASISSNRQNFNFDEIVRAFIRAKPKRGKTPQENKQEADVEDFPLEKSGRKFSAFNTNWITQYFILTERSLKQSRNTIFTNVNLLKCLTFGFIVGLVYFQLEYSENFALDIRSFCFFTPAYWTLMAMFEAMYEFPSQKEVLWKVSRKPMLVIN